jgi:hypothetical protein
MIQGTVQVASLRLLRRDIFGSLETFQSFIESSFESHERLPQVETRVDQKITELNVSEKSATIYYINHDYKKQTPSYSVRCRLDLLSSPATDLLRELPSYLGRSKAGGPISPLT